MNIKLDRKVLQNLAQILFRLKHRAQPEKFSAALALFIAKILYDKGLLVAASLDETCTTALECILLAIREAIGLNIDLDIALKASGLLDADVGINVDTSGNLALEADASAKVDILADASLKTNDDVNFNAGADIVTFAKTLSARILATGVVNALIGRNPSETELLSISKLVCRNLMQKMNIKLDRKVLQNLAQILFRLKHREQPEKFSAALARFTAKILYDRGLPVAVSLDDTCTTALECILLAIREAIGLNIDLDIALKASGLLETDLGINVAPSANLALQAELADTGLETKADVNVTQNLEAETNTGIIANVMVTDLISKFRNILKNQILATGILDFVISRRPSQTELLSISKLICKYLSNELHIDADNNIIKALFQGLVSLRYVTSADEYSVTFASILSNVLAHKGLLVQSNIEATLTSVLLSILLGIREGLKINIDLKAALAAAATVKLDLLTASSYQQNAYTDRLTDLNANIGIETNAGIGAAVNINATCSKFMEETTQKFATALAASDEFKLAVLMGKQNSVVSAMTKVINDCYGVEMTKSFAEAFKIDLDA